MTTRVCSGRPRLLLTGASLFLLAAGFYLVDVQAQSAAGLVAAYGFNEGSGTTVADSSGTSNNGPISGAAWTASGRFGSALSFDGVNDLVTIPDAASLDLTTAMTLEAWIYPTSSSGWRTVMLKEATGSLSYALYALDDAGRAGSWIRIGSTDYDTRTTSAPALNTWTHLAVTFGAGTLRVYRNGVQESSRTVSGSMTATSNPLRIGGNMIWGEYYAG